MKVYVIKAYYFGRVHTHERLNGDYQEKTGALNGLKELMTKHPKSTNKEYDLSAEVYEIPLNKVLNQSNKKKIFFSKENEVWELI